MVVGEPELVDNPEVIDSVDNTNEPVVTTTLEDVPGVKFNKLLEAIVKSVPLYLQKYELPIYCLNPVRSSTSSLIYTFFRVDSFS